MKSTTAAGGRVSDHDEIVIGVDMGTTSTKSVAYDIAGRVAASHSVGNALHEPRPGYAEQDPDAILAAVSPRTADAEGRPDPAHHFLENQVFSFSRRGVVLVCAACADSGITLALQTVL